MYWTHDVYNRLFRVISHYQTLFVKRWPVENVANTRRDLFNGDGRSLGRGVMGDG